MKLEINNVTIRTVLGDITQVDFADVIVNSASNSPAGGSGINSAIHKAAGKELLKAYKDLNGCETGEAKATLAFKLLTSVDGNDLRSVAGEAFLAKRRRCKKKPMGCIWVIRLTGFFCGLIVYNLLYTTVYLNFCFTVFKRQD